MKLRVHRILYHTSAEGMGNRSCIWVQGCRRRCDTEKIATAIFFGCSSVKCHRNSRSRQAGCKMRTHFTKQKRR